MDFPPMPLLPITTSATIAACKSLDLRPSDVFICSYPKSGTTWTQHIVLTLLLAEKCYAAEPRNGVASVQALDYNHVSEYAPFFEIDAHWDHNNSCPSQSIQNNHERLARRVFNTHLRWDMLPKSAAGSASNKSDNCTSPRPACAKFIYITRNQLDVCASFYHHLTNQKEGTYEHDFATFATDWMAGKIAFGSPIHHLLSFAPAFFGDNHYSFYNNDASTSNNRPLLLLSYERMKCNLRNEVLRIMDFLHLTHIPDRVLEKEILPSFEFDAMKDNINRFQPKSVTWLNGFTFLRRGTSGDGLAMMKDCRTAGQTSLLSQYDEWVEREGYREKIDELFNNWSSDEDEERNRVYEIFMSVVDHPQTDTCM